MYTIRRSVFETNSSSTHSICVAEDNPLVFPKDLDFDFKEYGWEVAVYDSTYLKASYLYTAVHNYGEISYINRIKEVLESVGVTCWFEGTNEESFPEIEDGQHTGYIDHGYNLEDFLISLYCSDQLLLNYLFSPFSFILTSNDNDGPEPIVEVSYAHQSFYKRN